MVVTIPRCTPGGSKSETIEINEEDSCSEADYDEEFSVIVKGGKMSRMSASSQEG